MTPIALFQYIVGAGLALYALGVVGIIFWVLLNVVGTVMERKARQ
jgi:hypothetical protein